MSDASQRPVTPPPPAAAPAKQKRSISPGQIIAGILFVLIVIFIVENTENVKIRIIAGPKVNAPVFVALLIAAVVGALISALLQYRHKRRSKK
ncbi:hypothetical protein [uncultured Jatrophihabitans sp.]|uniref:hypothetical protein n=1 Tax=uncultured Jatrophihabitans sp. TaxID=1610747 RepID=UPI0035C9BD2D